MRIRLNSSIERIRSSLFFLPMLAVFVGIAVSQVGIAADSGIDAVSWPLGLRSTVDSARAVLVAIAGATITFAGIAFSISVLLIQLGATQYSPRVVHSLFRDPFNKRVMGLVVGTFTYCLMVLRSVRSPLEEGGEAVIPNLSVSVAVLLGIGTILAIVAFINHSAHSMDISEILDQVTAETLTQIGKEWPLADPSAPAAEQEPEGTAGVTHQVRFRRNGWIRQLDCRAMLRCLPEGGVLHLETGPGRYAVAQTPLASMSPPPDDPDESDRGLLAAVEIGDTRSMQQDASFGLRQLTDVALRALSPGINDPTTAQDACFHAAAVLGEMLRRDPPPREHCGENGRRVVLLQQHTHEEMIGLAFDEVRAAAASQPTMCIYLLEVLWLLDESLVASGLAQRRAPLGRQARLVVESAEEAGLLAHDLSRVRSAYQKRFLPAGPSAAPVATAGG